MLDRIKKNILQPSNGFTVVELLISISVVSILSISLMSLMLNQFVVMSKSSNRTDLSIDSQNLLRSTVEAIRFGAGVRLTNTITDDNSPVGGWTTSNENFVIIIAIPAVDINKDYIIDSDTGSPYQNELVYYKSEATLLRRSLANASATGNTLTTSCPPELASSSCPADIVLTKDLSTMDFTFYDQDNTVTANPVLARSIKIELVMARTIFGSTTTDTNSIRTSLRNTF